MAAEGNRYYWLRLKEDFFSSKRIKKLKSFDKGDTYIIIYLKMQLSCIRKDGVLKYTGVEEDCASEIALDIDEDPDDVRFVIEFLLARGLAESIDDSTLFLPYAVENTGSESTSAQRVRDFRTKAKTLQCNTAPLQCNTSETQVKRACNVEKEKDIDIEKDIEKEINKERDTRARTRERDQQKESVKEFVPPSLEEITAYCEERHSPVNPRAFFDYYSASKWIDSRGSPVTNWKQRIIAWESDEEMKNWKPKKKKPAGSKPREFTPTQFD